MEVAAERCVGEHLLHQILAIVEAAFDGYRVHVRRRHGGHLAALHLGDAAPRIEHEKIDGGAVAAGLDRRRAGIARGSADDGDAIPALRQHMVEERTDQLQRVILEGEGWTVEELEEIETLR